MVIRAQQGILKPNPKYAMVSTYPSLSKTKHFTDALHRPSWLNSMHEELQASKQNNTWDLVPRTPGMNVIGSKWNYRIKVKFDGSTELFKARLISQEYS